MPRRPEGNPANPQGESGRVMLARMNGGNHEILANWGLDHLEFPARARAIDLGCGGGANLARLLDRIDGGTVQGVDYSALSVQVSLETNASAVAQEVCSVCEAGVAHLPFENESFDMATGFETIYFWPDVAAALSEVHRILRPGGALLICNEANGEDPAVMDFARTIEGMSVYSESDLVGFFETAGFSRIGVDNERESGRICVWGFKD